MDKVDNDYVNGGGPGDVTGDDVEVVPPGDAFVRSDSDRLDRRRPVHFPPIGRHNQPTVVFLTICAKDRRPLLATPNMHRLLVNAWQMAKAWLVGDYLIMPDHVHLFCAPSGWPPPSFRSWVKYWKSLVARTWRKEGSSGGGGDKDSNRKKRSVVDTRPLWQRDFWDTQMRSLDHYRAKCRYVMMNPVRKGLVKNPDDWPYRGSLTGIVW